MNENKNSFKLLMDQDDSWLDQDDHQEIQQNIHNRMGTLRFVGHIADMYLNKMFRTAGMKMGGRYNGRFDLNQSDEYGPAGPSQP